MGTSASNNGPKGSPPLLPDWYNGGDSPESPPQDNNNDSDEEGNDNDTKSENSQSDTRETPTDQSKDWGKSRGALTRISNNTGGSANKKAAKNYINSLGGTNGAVKSARQGIRVGGEYANFLNSWATNGLDNTLNSLGLQEYIGKSTQETCTAIANKLAPTGGTNDEAIARDALISTLDSLYSKAEESDANPLENLNSDLIKETLIEYVSNYIFTKWMYELGSAIEKGSISETEAISLEGQVKDLIHTETIERYRNVSIDSASLNTHNTSGVIENIFRTAYSTLEQ